MKIVLGITGSIAAYKALEITRKFKKLGEEVFCVMTKEANNFVSPLSFATLAGNEVLLDFFSQRISPIHIELAKCDVILVAPATYNFINKVASGIADDALSCIISATKSTVIFAPCMDSGMWENKILQENIKKLKELGYYFIEPEVGELATLKIGKGRLPTPEFIVNEVYKIIYPKKEFLGKKVIVTGGRTEEDIDPVRVITNKSTGKMGCELAKEFYFRGADVTFVHGKIDCNEPLGVKNVKVGKNEELTNELISRDYEILVMAAAIADYTPYKYFKNKIKDDKINIEFIKTKDILKLVREKKKKTFIVGFSLESENHVEKARKKMKEKGLNLIIANDVSAIGSDKIKPILIEENKEIELPLLSKEEAAKKIIDWIAAHFMALGVK